ncbi:hypothetical protein HDU97_004641 [Phlyctochytrium planicorne]|nr:hypothetical protein HDU97_004641 [Phlyctochytrium planicorne]
MNSGVLNGNPLLAEVASYVADTFVQLMGTFYVSLDNYLVLRNSKVLDDATLKSIRGLNTKICAEMDEVVGMVLELLGNSAPNLLTCMLDALNPICIYSGNSVDTEVLKFRYWNSPTAMLSNFSNKLMNQSQLEHGPQDPAQA